MYYPGCTIKRNSIEYEKASIAVLREIGMDVYELDEWYCCGGMYSLTIDDVMKHLGAVRTLISAQVMGRKLGTNYLMMLCPMCFNVLKRVNKLLKEDPGKLDTVNKFLDEEDYEARVTVHHILEILYENREAIKEKVKRDLSKLRVAPYYGCTVLRPREIGVDNPENPHIMEDIISALGATSVYYPFRSSCCGAFHIVRNRDIVYRLSGKIINSISAAEADVVVTICPLCNFNLVETLLGMRKPPRLKVIYLTQLIAYAMGLDSVLDNDIVSFLDEVLSEKR